MLTTDDLKFVATRIWRYLNIYFLKPHDAINDTLTSYLLTRFEWSGKFLEVGSGDGMFSYVMHGGRFPLHFDRYLMIDLGKSDIFDTHLEKIIDTKVILKFPHVDLAIDAKIPHVLKIKEIAFSNQVLCAPYESLPIKDGAYTNIFFYTAHGLADHSEALGECCRVLTKNGRIILLCYNSNFKSAFWCNRLSKRFDGKVGDYFKKLDNGRYEEITKMSKTENQWLKEFEKHGLSVEACYSGLTNFAWGIYDIQTRPFLKALIRFFASLPTYLRAPVKLIWMVVLFPYLFIFFLLFARPQRRYSDKSCYLAFELRKI